jgi:hypothetical protein
LKILQPHFNRYLTKAVFLELNWLAKKVVLPIWDVERLPKIIAATHL